MGAQRIQYQIVGRYMNGKTVTGYHLQSIDTGKAGKYTKEQVCFLVGRDQVTNCSCQIYKDGVLLRGKGMSLDDLPVQYEDGKMKNTENMGKIAKDATASDVMTKFTIVGKLTSGRKTVGYVVQNAGLGIKKVKRSQVIELAKAGKIANARVQVYQGKDILRGVGCNLDELPAESIGEETTHVTKEAVANDDGIIVNAKTASADIIKVVKKLAHNIGERVVIRNTVINDSSKQASNKARLSFETNFDKEALMNTIEVTFNNTRDIVMDLAITLSSDSSKVMGTQTTKSFKDIMTAIKKMIDIKNDLAAMNSSKTKEVGTYLEANDGIEVKGSNFSDEALKCTKKLAHNISVRVPIRNITISDFGDKNDKRARLGFETNFDGNTDSILYNTIDLSATSAKDINMNLSIVIKKSGKVLTEVETNKFDTIMSSIKQAIKSKQNSDGTVKDTIKIIEGIAKSLNKLGYNFVPDDKVNNSDIYNYYNYAYLSPENSSFELSILKGKTVANFISLDYSDLSIENASINSPDATKLFTKTVADRLKKAIKICNAKIDEDKKKAEEEKELIKNSKIIISISSFKTNGEPYLVDFNCKSEKKLHNFAKWMKSNTKHKFINNGTELIDSSLGKEYYAIFDDAEYSLAKYKELADKRNEEIVAIDNFDVFNATEGDYISDTEEVTLLRTKIKEKLAKLGIKVVKDRR